MRIHYTIYTLVFLLLQPVYAETHHPQEFLQSISGDKNEGKEIYNHFCVNCHASKPLIPLGAPRIGNEADWKVRLQQGMKVLFEHTNEGLNAMPPRGGCFECTDKQLKRAIKYMLPKQPKS
ncbi:c-type cytochrome [Fluoribacter dumoffii]|uniref:Cytochrome c5 n=1 Tax=Fluoribacter dumoffii TaxID=463 RepID=A0A377G7L8_9GAMM|nr:c-type cytochrome [Fluoribacter dumoffii]KTC89700.1 cytochrome c5 [Fluoribacter dumoffii NY 23]MCW8384894.1 c-type cytochrome [Fluoribacter dumoffii]MCW8417956.1 c-type cytochrome [Fluoribacter dumoffii]MCW8454202.1 c-type cytochrome [Fluoribacter dumoffii]MCW8461724.1 c-type cytochrome [Fluoribacter dumoffii]